MVTGASTADLAVVLLDARKGVLTQTRRHTYLAKLMGIKKVVLAVNKMDMVNYSQKTFDAICKDFVSFTQLLGDLDVTPIPLSALRGDNITTPSQQMAWYVGTTLMEYLETTPIERDSPSNQVFRMPIQWVNRPHQDFRGLSGTVASGRINVGQRIRIQPSGQEVDVARIVTKDADLASAIAGQAITITLSQEVDASRAL